MNSPEDKFARRDLALRLEGSDTLEDFFRNLRTGLETHNFKNPKGGTFSPDETVLEANFRSDRPDVPTIRLKITLKDVIFKIQGQTITFPVSVFCKFVNWIDETHDVFHQAIEDLITHCVFNDAEKVLRHGLFFEN